MMASCPVCTQAVDLVGTNGGIMSGWLEERYHCYRCKVTIRVEFQIIPDAPAVVPKEYTPRDVAQILCDNSPRCDDGDCTQQHGEQQK